MNSMFKGYDKTTKAVVISTDDPESLGRVQIWMPSYHNIISDYKIDSGTTRVGLPWAYVATSSVTYNVNDVVYIMFEGGDIRYPICIGTTATVINLEESAGTEGDPSLLFGGTLTTTIADLFIGSSLVKGSTTVDTSSKVIYDFGVLDWGAKVWETDFKVFIETCYGINSSDTLNILGEANYNSLKNSKSWHGFELDLSTDLGLNFANLINSETGQQAQMKMLIAVIESHIQRYKIVDTTGMAYVSLYMLSCYEDSRTNSGTSATVGSIISDLCKTNKNISADTLHTHIKGVLSDRGWSEDSDTFKRLDEVKAIIDENAYLLTRDDDIANLIIPEDSASSEPSPSEAEFTLPYWVFGDSDYTNISFGFQETTTVETTDENGDTVEVVLSSHRGIDIIGTLYEIVGQPAIAPCKGKIVRISNLNTGVQDLDPSYGNACDLLIDGTDFDDNYHDNIGIYNNQVVLRYAHFRELCVGQDDVVSVGSILGFVGNTGTSYGEHLHLEIIFNYKKSAYDGIRDPLKYLQTKNIYKVK